MPRTAVIFYTKHFRHWHCARHITKIALRTKTWWAELVLITKIRRTKTGISCYTSPYYNWHFLINLTVLQLAFLTKPYRTKLAFLTKTRRTKSGISY
jgi:hypothetical protein